MHTLVLGVGNRCAVDLDQLQLPIHNHEIIEILQKRGYEKIDVDIDLIARSLVGVSQFKRSARMSELPAIVNCSLMIKWLYAQKGIWIPRYAIEQLEYLTVEVSPTDIQSGDLVFRQGYHGLYWSDSSKGIGHVGIVTSRRTVIHATNKVKGVAESDLDAFSLECGRGIRRFPNFSHLVTFQCPDNHIVECSSEFRWIILQTLA